MVVVIIIIVAAPVAILIWVGCSSRLQSQSSILRVLFKYQIFFHETDVNEGTLTLSKLNRSYFSLWLGTVEGDALLDINNDASCSSSCQELYHDERQPRTRMASHKKLREMKLEY